MRTAGGAANGTCVPAGRRIAGVMVAFCMAVTGCQGDDGDTPVAPRGPAPDLVVDSLTVSRPDPTDLERVEIGFRIHNAGDAATPGRVPFEITIDGSAMEFIQVNRLQSHQSIRFLQDRPPLEAGLREIAVVLDPDNRIEEHNEENNRAATTVRVASQQLLTPEQPVTVSSGTVDEVLLFRIDIDEPVQEALNVQLSGGSGDADMFVHYGERPEHYYEYGCVSGNAASDELCQMVPTRQGSYHVAVHAFTAFGPSTLTVSVGGKPVEKFDIEVVFLDHGTPSQDEIVREAARRWESVIARGAKDIDFTGARSRPADECFPGQPAVSEEIDDLRIWVAIEPIDGVGGGVAIAGPCSWRITKFQASDTIYQETVLGAIRLDEADVGRMETNGVLLPVVVHEIAHVLGFGNSWERHRLLQNPSLPANLGADTHFTGRLATAAFAAAGGARYTEGARVPVENRSQEGSSDAHWRESVFNDELMTPFVGDGHALSLITIESLADLGYGVDITQAESYTLPAARPAGVAAERGPVVHLGDDIARWPVVLIDQKGRVAGVRRPGRD